MKIGIFTDTYRPSVNGIVYVTEILRRNFEDMGHEVFIFAPGASLSNKNDAQDDHIIRFPSVGGMVYDDFNASLFFPPKVLKQVESLELDIIHFLTPGPVGIMGMYSAKKLHILLVAEYCTDLFEYVEHYPSALLAIAGLGVILPFTLKTSREELFGMIKAGRPRLGVANWNRENIKHLLTVIHSHCDAVIVHSRKSAEQLLSWQDGDRYPVHIIPTGIDAPKPPTAAQLTALKKQWGVEPADEVVLYLGRLSAEKNLDLLINMMDELIKWRPHAKLIFVGDFDYRPTLEAHAKESAAHERIVFVGKVPHEEIGWAHATAKVFAFPSLTDTQSLALHEAAQSGLPIVMVDEPVTEVVKEGENGFFCKNDPIDMAAKISRILEDPALQKKMSEKSKRLAAKFGERTQCEETLGIYKAITAKQKTELAAAPTE